MGYHLPVALSSSVRCWLVTDLYAPTYALVMTAYVTQDKIVFASHASWHLCNVQCNI